MATVVEETPGFASSAWPPRVRSRSLWAAALRPHLVLMDVNLPGIDGVRPRGVCGEPSPRPWCVLLSTYDEDAGEHFVAESGAAAYVTKSAFGPDRLRAVWGSWARSAVVRAGNHASSVVGRPGASTRSHRRPRPGRGCGSAEAARPHDR